MCAIVVEILERDCQGPHGELADIVGFCSAAERINFREAAAAVDQPVVRVEVWFVDRGACDILLNAATSCQRFCALSGGSQQGEHECFSDVERHGVADLLDLVALVASIAVAAGKSLRRSEFLPSNLPRGEGRGALERRSGVVSKKLLQGTRVAGLERVFRASPPCSYSPENVAASRRSHPGGPVRPAARAY